MGQEGKKQRATNNLRPNEQQQGEKDYQRPPIGTQAEGGQVMAAKRGGGGGEGRVSGEEASKKAGWRGRRTRNASPLGHHDGNLFWGEQRGQQGGSLVVLILLDGRQLRNLVLGGPAATAAKGNT